MPFGYCVQISFFIIQTHQTPVSHFKVYDSIIESEFDSKPYFASLHNGSTSKTRYISAWSIIKIIKSTYEKCSFCAFFYRNGSWHQNIVKITFSHNKMFVSHPPPYTEISPTRERKRASIESLFIVFVTHFWFLDVVSVSGHLLCLLFGHTTFKRENEDLFYRKRCFIHRLSGTFLMMQTLFGIDGKYWITYQ